MPALTQAWDSCARSSLPREWNSAQNIHQENRQMGGQRGEGVGGTYPDKAIGS
jgi:hypothetical protein